MYSADTGTNSLKYLPELKTIIPFSTIQKATIHSPTNRIAAHMQTYRVWRLRNSIITVDLMEVPEYFSFAAGSVYFGGICNRLYWYHIELIQQWQVWSSCNVLCILGTWSPAGLCNMKSKKSLQRMNDNTRGKCQTCMVMVRSYSRGPGLEKEILQVEEDHNEIYIIYKLYTGKPS